MFFYDGYSCPVCKKPFVETDDIVTCPDCGAPHHRTCWQQEKRCFYADKHNTSEQWSREKAPTVEQTVEDGQICNHCGAKNSSFAEFCSCCGHDLDAEEWTSATPQPTQIGGEYREYRPFTAPHFGTNVDDNEAIDGVKARDLRTFVGQNAHYYLPHFQKMFKKGSVAGWNWAAFLLTPYWLWYRKQYLYGSVVLLFKILQTFCTTFFLYGYLGASSVSGYAELATIMQQHMSDPVFFKWELVVLLCSVIEFLICILFGAFGNYLYFRSAKKRIATAKSTGSADFNIARLGGVSVLLGGISFAILYYIVPTMLSMWFM